MLLTSYGCMSATPPQPTLEHPAVKTYKSFFNVWTNTINKSLNLLDEYTMMSKDSTFYVKTRLVTDTFLPGTHSYQIWHIIIPSLFGGSERILTTIKPKDIEAIRNLYRR